jgi:cation-transporting ATPase E
MKAADCSIAIGSEADAARHVAQLTLLSGDFAVLPEAVAEGRRVIGNIRRTSALFLVKTIYSILLSLLTLILPIQYPFQPIQLSLISSLTIGIPGFFLALEPNRERVGGSFLRAVLMTAAPGGVAVAIGAAMASILDRVGLAPADCSSMAVLIAGIVGLIQLWHVSRPLNRLRTAVLAGMSLAFAFAVAFLGRIFFLTVRSMPVNCWLWLAGELVLAIAIMWLVERLTRKIAARRQQTANG